MGDSQIFASALSQCIREAAARGSSAFERWGDGCIQPTVKVDVQAEVLGETVTAFEEKYGYQAALWCTFYSSRMNGEEFRADNPQPNNPEFMNWYETILCPWDLNNCGNEELGLHGDEKYGVPTEWAGNGQNFKYVGEPERRTMSCGLCGFLARTLGPPPFTLPLAPILDDPGRELIYGNNWDMHPFGAWLANTAWAKRGTNGWAVLEVAAKINNFRASNGEEMHGYMWQSLRLLTLDFAQATDPADWTTAPRKAEVDDLTAAHHIATVCGTTWELSPQSRDDCFHGAGHGLFYYYMDIGRAVKGCWHEAILATAPNWLTAQELLRVRWLCASGIYHSAGNSLSVAGFKAVIAAEITAQEFLCKFHDDEWGAEDHYFARCNAGLGMEEAEFKLSQVVRGDCPDPLDAATGEVLPPSAWEQKQMRLPTIQQRSCNPAFFFGQANEQCPAAFMAHFPCKPGAPDFMQCNSQHHEQCQNDNMMRTTFLCPQLPERKHNNRLVVNHVLDGQENGVGLWGGTCTCPDGAVYLVGDNGDLCGSLACVNGVAGKCNEWFSYEWAYRKVVCATADDSLLLQQAAAEGAAKAKKAADEEAAKAAAEAEAAAAEAEAAAAREAEEKAAQEAAAEAALEAEKKAAEQEEENEAALLASAAAEAAKQAEALAEAAEREAEEEAEAAAEAEKAAREAELAELQQEVAVAKAEAAEAAAEAEAAEAEAEAAAAQAKAEAKAAAQRAAQMDAAAAAAAEAAATPPPPADIHQMLRQSAQDVVETASVMAETIKSSPTAARVGASVGSRTKATIESVSAALPPNAGKIVSEAAEWPLLVAAIAAGVLLVLCCCCCCCLCRSGGKAKAGLRSRQRKQERSLERRGLVGSRAVLDEEYGGY